MRSKYFTVSSHYISWFIAYIMSDKSLYILNAVRCPYIRSPVTLGVANSVANDVIMRIAGLVAGCERRRREPREYRHKMITTLQ